MIYERDLDESIARYQGDVNPSIETCRKLAACLIVKRELFGEPDHLPETGQSYSYADEPATEPPTISYDSGTAFSAAINGRDPNVVWPVMDELMSAIQISTPRLYINVMKMLQS